ncbi:MAG: hypothetical protein LBI03_05730, partial [Clostridiales bacterium]|nr:hypothetical protein [Clostridiales bacterium]
DPTTGNEVYGKVTFDKDENAFTITTDSTDPTIRILTLSNVEFWGTTAQNSVDAVWYNNNTTNGTPPPASKIDNSVAEDLVSKLQKTTGTAPNIVVTTQNNIIIHYNDDEVSGTSDPVVNESGSAPKAGQWFYNQDDGYFYYIGTVEAGSQTADLLRSVELNSEAGSEYANIDYTLIVNMLSIQNTVDAMAAEFEISQYSTGASLEVYNALVGYCEVA